ncbi:transposase [Mycolicibacterium conceptionense]|uniref:transposase n=1 Tax=Mycolicibacterium conceptionense TaxID=451644 RepID=UPI001F1825BD|nr:transposase [Mycolicibacterium conceptionense]
MKIIGEKADHYGRTVHTVSRWLASSKTCSTPGCGHRLDELPLQIRTWVCPACQATHDRDYNAAKVILAAGRAERLNDCGARVRPQPVAAVGVETGSTPTAA